MKIRVNNSFICQKISEISLILYKDQGSYLLNFQNSSGFSLVVDTLIADTECIGKSSKSTYLWINQVLFFRAAKESMDVIAVAHSRGLLVKIAFDNGF